MTIETVCPECGKSYRVRDEMAGKRFRCKACQSAISIPIPDTDDAPSEADDEPWNEDFLGGLDAAVKSERRTPAGAPAPIAGRSSAGSSSQKKSKTKQKSSDGDGAGSAVKIVGGILGGLVGLVVGYLVVSSLMGGGSGDAPAWQGFTSPDAVWQVEFPGAPQLTPLAGATPESKRYVGETPQIGAAVSDAPLPANADNLAPQQTLDLMANQFAQQRPGAAIGGQHPIGFGKHPAMEFVLTTDADGKSLANTTRILLTENAAVTLEFVTAGADNTADRDRFFNSFQLLGDTTAKWSNEAPP